jgi:hypothetical protein
MEEDEEYPHAISERNRTVPAEMAPCLVKLLSRRGVMELFHYENLFENWTGGKAAGKEAVRQVWTSRFADHGDFRFTEEETFVDEAQQKVLYRWQLDWPSFEKGYDGKPEKMRGVDVIHFKDEKIIKKLTYSKTSILIDGKMVSLSAQESEH